MKARELFIGIDSGTQGTKALALDAESGAILAQAYASHDLVEGNDGTREQAPHWWTAACTKVLEEVLADPEVRPEEVRGIGVSGQQHGFVPLDRRGEVLRPAKLWCDTSTAAQCESITREAGGPQAVIKAVGNSVAAGFTASKVRWLAENEPDHFEKLDAVLLPHDYINFWLTGEKVAEFGDASGTAFFDVASRTWSETMLRAVDPSGKLAECLPRLIEAHEPAGTLRPDIAEQFGLSTDVLVSAGGGDNMMAAIGTGNVVPGVVTASLGTSGTIYAYSDRPVIDPAGELAAFCSSTGGWLPLVCTMNVTVTTELVRNFLGRDLDVFNTLAEEALPGCGGVTLVPFFNGERTPALPGATASIHGLTGTNFFPPNVCRAAMEGATFGLRYGLDVLRGQGVEPKEIRLVGGGAKSPLWRQITADIFGCPVVCPVSTEAGALGAAIQAAWCRATHLSGKADQAELRELTDRFVAMDSSLSTHPDGLTAEHYTLLYDQYLKLVDTLTPLYC